MTKSYRCLKMRKRRHEAGRDVYAYLKALPEAEREWMEIFLDAEYGADSAAQMALSPDAAYKKQWASESNHANYADRTDLTQRMRRTGDYVLTRRDEGRAMPLDPTPNVFPPNPERVAGYSPADYAPSDPSESTEDAMIDAIDAMTAEERSMKPYGFRPRNLKPGHFVQVCLPAHYLKDRIGTVLAYRPWTNDYLIEANRRTYKNRDGSSKPTTLCWVSPDALRRAEPKAVEDSK